MFEGRVSPDEVWDCVMHLPRESATMAALFDDPGFEVSDEARELRLTEFSPEVEALSDVYDLLASILAHLSAFTSKRPVKVPPRRRPGEARRERLRAERSAQARREWSELLVKLGVPE